MWKVYSWAGIALLSLTPSCTKQQAVNAVDTVAQIGVDLCQEAPQLLPPGASGVVSLVCQAYNQTEKTANVLIDQAIWNSMKFAYLQQHGTLPKGMTLPPQSMLAPAVPMKLFMEPYLKTNAD